MDAKLELKEALYRAIMDNYTSAGMSYAEADRLQRLVLVVYDIGVKKVVQEAMVEGAIYHDTIPTD